MKHKLIIFVIVLAYFVSVSGGLASLLETGQNPVNTTPVAVAGTGPKIVKPRTPVNPPGPPRGGATTNGESWGG